MHYMEIKIKSVKTNLTATASLGSASLDLCQAVVLALGLLLFQLDIAVAAES